MPSFARELEQTLHNALTAASTRRHEYATLEHLLLALVDDEHASKVMIACGVDLREIKDAVTLYLDTELGGVMIVEFKDFLVALDCPDDFWTSQSTMDAVSKVIPGKPIKFVAPSHTHGDHGGGARAYYYSGATLITTRGNVGFYQKLAGIKQTIRPDPLSQQPRQPIIEVLKRKRVITDGTQTLELHDIGPNAHTEEMTFAYLPKQKILWQSDLFLTPQTGGGLNKALPVGIDFANKLKALGITDFSQMVESHHTRSISADEFRQSLKKAGYEEY